MKESNIILPVGVGIALYFLFSGDSKSSSDTSTNKTTYTGPMGSPTAYIKQFAPVADQIKTFYAVPKLVTLAQAGLESAWGASGVATNAKNHFGIKADKSWLGPSYGDYRKYNNPSDSYSDYGKFLVQNQRYKSAFNYSDPYSFAKAVAAAGYSENPAYANLLSDVITSVDKIIKSL